MNRKSILGLIFLFIILGFSNSKEFQSPVNGVIRLSGTFGELRHNHFHAGIDIKSRNGRPGDPIYAIDKGFVSRIRMSASGYGNAVYISHPNGYTSVYAHLHNFNNKLTEFIRRYQERHETFEIEIYPAPNQLQITSREKIGSMGNTGSSAGVHLHFEIRDSKTESPVNPLRWNFNYIDDHNPFASRLYLYQIDQGPQIKLIRNLKLSGAYHDRSPYPSDISLPSGKYGLGIKAFDPFNSWRNRNGIYQIKLMRDDTLAYQFSMDSIPFHLSKYINTHIDHEHYCSNKSLRHRLFKLKTNKAPIYTTEKTDGTFILNEGDSINYKIKVLDYKGRQSDIQFRIIGTKAAETKRQQDSLSLYIPPGKDTVVQSEECSIYIPQNAFFEAAYINPIFKISDDSLPVIDIEENCEAIYHGIEYRFQLPEIPDSVRQKMYIGKIQGARIKDCGGIWKGDQISESIKELGQFSVFIDTTAPEIDYLYGHFQAGKTVTFSINNETLSTFRHIDLHYAAYINNKWHFASFDKRTMRLKIKLPMNFNADTDTLTVIAKDRLGNGSDYTYPL